MQTQLHSIQVLRAIAALLVVVFHITQSWRDDFGLFAGNIFPAGSSGVDIFFVISGFIMCLTTSGADRSPLSFAAKRFARIAPLYYVLTLLVFAVAVFAPALLASTTANPEFLLKSLLFIPYARNDGALEPILFLGWTLNYEMFFYLVFTLALLFPKHTLRIVIPALFALVALGVISPSESVIARFYTNDIILEFAWGCLIFLAWRRWPRVFAKMWPLALIGGVALLVQSYFPHTLPRSIAGGLPAALILCGVLGVTLPAGKARDFGVRLGDASYSIYLVHPIVLELVGKILIRTMGMSGVSAALQCVVTIIATCVISLILFARFERPINDWLRERLLGAQAKPKRQAA